MLVSVSSLFVVSYQTNLIGEQTELIRQEQRISVLPYLQIGSSTPGHDIIKLYLVNSGIGPALIKEVKVMKGKDVFNMDLSDYFRYEYSKQGEVNSWYEFESIKVGDLIPAGERLTLIATNTSDSLFVNYMEALDNRQLNFEIIYSSLYDEQWKISSSESGILPVRLQQERE